MGVAFDAQSESHGGTTGSVSEASFSWTHTPVGTPSGVVVHTAVMADADDATSVTYGGVNVPAVSGGRAVCTDGDEDCELKTWFLGSGIPTGAQTVVVNRNNNATVMYAGATTVTALTDTEVHGIVLVQSVGTLAEINIDDGSPGTNSLRIVGLNSGLNAPPGPGANSTSGHSIDLGVRSVRFTRETTPGQGSRPVGPESASSDDRAAVYFAIREVSSAITGTIAVTQDHQTAAFTGTVANPITGTIGVTQDHQTAAFAGSLGISGTIASTQQDQTAAFTGSVMGGDWDCADWDPLDWVTDCAPTGVLASTQDNQTAAFTGTVANPITGTIGVTQQDQTAAFVGTTVSDGVISSIQQDQTGAFVGTVANPVSGTIGVTQANQTGAFAGTVTAPAVTGTIGVTQQDQIGAFTGQSISTAVTGTIAVTQANQTMAAAGIVAMAVTGTVAVTQQNQTGTFVGSVLNPADTIVVSVTCTIGGPSATCTISPEMAVVGSDVVITSNFENAAGNPADPASVTAVVEAPDGTQSTPTPMSIAVGEWTTTIPTDQYGFWFFEITGQGDDVNIVCKGSFCVDRSLVSV